MFGELLQLSILLEVTLTKCCQMTLNQCTNKVSSTPLLFMQRMDEAKARCLFPFMLGGLLQLSILLEVLLAKCCQMT